MSKSKLLLFLANCEVCVQTGLMRSESCKSVLQCTSLDHTHLNNLQKKAKSELFIFLAKPL